MHNYENPGNGTHCEILMWMCIRRQSVGDIANRGRPSPCLQGDVGSCYNIER